MYKITINFLPPELKVKELKRKKFSLVVLAYLLIGLLAFSIFFLSFDNHGQAGVLLEKEDKEKELQEYLASPENEEIKQKADELKKLRSIENKVEEKKMKTSDILIDLDKITPQGIKITSFRVSNLTKEVLIKGIALKREDLLDFTSYLKTWEKLKDVQSPVASLIKKENIDFSIQAKLAL